MDKYIILSPEAKGSFNDRLNFLYLKLGNYLDTEKLGNRTLQYCKVFLSDAQNQIREFEESLLYQEYLKNTHLTVVEQPPLNGSKISLLIIEVITFYITDDRNHLPVRLDMYLNFGSAKAFLTDIKGNRHPLTSIVKER